MLTWIRKIRIGLLHASFHRNMKNAELARENQDIIKFKKYIYQAENAWRKIVLLSNQKQQKNG